MPTGSTIGTVGTHSYKYDALGRRVSKTVAGTTTTVYVSDGSQEIAEYANGGAANAPQIQYVFGNYIDEPLMMISGSNKYYYHNNSLYSVAALTDAAGAVVERYRYDPYGKVTILAADGVTVRTASSYSNPWTYTGRRSDGETGLMYYRARVYSTELGRFISRWTQLSVSLSLYDYQFNKPTTLVDPFGDPDPDQKAGSTGGGGGSGSGSGDGEIKVTVGRINHILDGEVDSKGKIGGGHGPGRGTPGKTSFPDSMTDTKIIQEVKRIENDPSSYPGERYQLPVRG